MFGETVRTYRLRLGLSQEDLAQAAGVDVKTIGNIEAGRRRPRLSTLGLIADALGLDPAERDHLRSLAVPGAPGAPGAEPVETVPAQLPADVAGFTGRTAQLERLDALLTGPAESGTTAGGRARAVVVSAISGTAGIGKTALAVHWAHRVAHRFPDGQLYVNLRGFDPGGQVMDPAEAVRGLLDALGVPPDRIPPQPDAQAALYRSRLAGKRILILLDNARDSAQARPLLPGTPTCLVLVTSRNQLTGLITTGAQPLTLDLLTPDESHQLLARRLGPDRAAAEPDAVTSIVAACARLPLALAIAAARAQQTGFALTALAAELGHATGRLDALDTGETSTQIRAVFSWSYQALTPPAARLFRLLGLHPGPDITPPATASLSGHPLPETRRLLADLTRANLLAEHTPGRYGLHDLLRAYVAHLADTETPEHERDAATRRLLDHYTHTAHAAARLADPHLDPIPLPLTQAVTGARPEHLADHRQASAWLSTERPVLLAILRHAAALGYHTDAWQLAWAVRRFLDRQGRTHNLAAIAQIALDAARNLDDPGAQAFAHRLLARADVLLGHYARAHARLKSTLDLYAQAGDPVGQAEAHNDTAILWERQGHLDKSLDHAYQFLALAEATDHLDCLARAHNAVGWYQSRLGDYAQGLSNCEQAIPLLRRLRDRPGEASTWDSIGYAYSHLGDHEKAIECYRRSLALCSEFSDRHGEAETLAYLGDAHRRGGDPEAAREAWRAALAILTDLNDADAEQVCAKLRALDHDR